MTKREIVYMVLDAIKSINSDSYIVEEHVLFLMNIYRVLFILQKLKQDPLFRLSEEYYQELCIDLELVNAIPNVSCSNLYLKSTQLIPSTFNNTINVYTKDLFNTSITNVNKERFKYIKTNKYTKSMIYSTIGSDSHLYIKSDNGVIKYLRKINVSGIFEDYEKAEQLSCDNNSIENCVDALDKKFPIPGELIPLMIETISNQLKQALYTPADDINNDKDDIASIIQYMRNNAKSNLQKQIEGQ